MISAQALEEFKALLKRDYGWSGDDETTLKIANDFLISLEAILAKPKVDSNTRKEG